MTHEHTHKLSFACMDCIKKRVYERNKLLAFVKKIANLETVPGEYRAYIIIQAMHLLKELGFENE